MQNTFSSICLGELFKFSLGFTFYSVIMNAIIINQFAFSISYSVNLCCPQRYIVITYLLLTL